MMALWGWPGDAIVCRTLGCARRRVTPGRSLVLALTGACLATLLACSEAEAPTAPVVGAPVFVSTSFYAAVQQTITEATGSFWTSLDEISAAELQRIAERHYTCTDGTLADAGAQIESGLEAIHETDAALRFALSLVQFPVPVPPVGRVLLTVATKVFIPLTRDVTGVYVANREIGTFLNRGYLLTDAFRICVAKPPLGTFVGPQILLFPLFSAFVPPGTATLQGTVRDAITRAPIPAEITLGGPTVSGISSADGSFTFSPIIHGRYSLTVERVGYRGAVLSEVVVSPGGTLTQDVYLTPLKAAGTPAIAFASNRSGNFEIYLMHPDGSGTLQLTTSPGNDLQSEWSPDGRRIAFASDRDGDLDIYVMDPDGSKVRQLTNSPGADHRPSWSPDGTKLAFESQRDGVFGEIYTMKADGTNPQRLTTLQAGELNPDWSPDGTQIAWFSFRDFDPEIYVMNADGTNQTRLTNSPGDDIDPAWSPGGTKLVFESDRDDTEDLYTLTLSSLNVTRLETSFTGEGTPDWSPDGTRLVLTVEGSGQGDIWVMNQDGSSLVNLTPGSLAEDIQPSWRRHPLDLPPLAAVTSVVRTGPVGE
jgi:hypothetical protein